ncbi:MAG: glycerol kinase GlpK [Bdellovibrionales bacterium]
MNQKYILSIDQGTTGTTVSLFDRSGQRVCEANEDFKQIFPKPGWVEHDPEDIWNSVRSTIKLALQKIQAKPEDVAAIGITNQRETVMVWDRATGKPIYNAIVWQCRRTSDFCEKLKKKKLEKVIKEKTGLVIDPYFSASKIRWILDHVSGSMKRAKSGELACGTVDTFLLWRLTGGKSHATDVSNASRTQLMNIKTGKWDAELLKIFGVPEELLPEIRPSSGVFGVTKGMSELVDRTPIAGIAGDQQAALFGQNCFKVGEAKCTYGTGSFLLVNSGTKCLKAKSGALTTIAWQLSEKSPIVYALEGSAFVSGAAVQWLRDGLEFIQSSQDIEGLAKLVQDSDGVEFVPALTGLGAPHWDPEARGLICGLTRGTTKAHLARATLEGIALQNSDLLMAMSKDLGKKISSLRVDGGASANNLLMQIQSDYLNLTLVRPEMVETTSAGAAYLAGLGVGIWKNLTEITKVWKIDRNFKPAMTTKDRTLRLARWKKAIERTMMK